MGFANIIKEAVDKRNEPTPVTTPTTKAKVSLDPLKQSTASLGASTGTTAQPSPSLQQSSPTAPTLQDFISEAQKLGQQSTAAQAETLREDTKDVAGDFVRSIYGRNIDPSGPLGKEITERAISSQTKRLEPMAERVAAQTGQQALQQRYQMTQQALDEIKSGNLSGTGAQAIVSNAYGPGVTITTDDEKALRDAALASGLNEEEFLTMKRAIGTTQWDDIMNNPTDYIESPQKMRDFQMALAEMQANAMKESASTQAGASKSAAQSAQMGQAAVGLATLFSDERLKENIEIIPNAISIIEKIKPVTFNFINGGKESAGVIAQELKEILPEYVHADESGIHSVDYNAVFSILIKAVQELNNKVKGQ